MSKYGVKYERNNKIYNGAGVIIMEKINKELCAVLFKNINFYGTSRYVYSELGGKIDKTDLINKNVLQNTAIREALEESCELIKFTTPDKIKKHKNFCDVKHVKSNTYFRCYFILIKKDLMNINDYKKNRKMQKMNNNKISEQWRETRSLTRIKISDIITNDNVNNITKCRDIYDNIVHITSKTVSCLKKASKNGIFDRLNESDFVKINAKSVINNVYITQLVTL